MNVKRGVATLACLVATATYAPVPGAQTVERFKDRLSRLSVDRATTSAVSGQGAVSAMLDGHELTITVTFEGMNSSATVAHLHNAPRARPGPVAFTIEAPPITIGKISNTITLTDPQREELRGGRYYLQIHTEGNPGGELRGWLLPQ